MYFKPMKHSQFSILTLLAVFLLPMVTFAQTVEQVKVEGNKRVEEATIRSYLAFTQGAELNEKRVDESIKNLFATGLFSDIVLEDEGEIVTVVVVENPIINEVAFEGNKRIDNDELQQEVRLQSREVYTKSRVQADVKRIMDLYRKSGRFSARVTPKAIQLDQNRINLVYEIEEGDKAVIDYVRFVGNENFDEGKLRKALATQESKWYRFFSSTDVYDADRIAYDRELLRKFYVNQGFADFRVTTSIAEISAEKTSFMLTFFIEEGQAYHFGEIKVESKLADLKDDEVRESILSVPDELFNADLVDKTVDNITEQLNDIGFAFVEVRPQYKAHKEAQLMDVTYNISEGPKVYVDRINIHGNVRTLDTVVRREFRLTEGDPYNAAKIRRSEQRIRNLGFFEKVEVNNIKSEEAPDKVILDVKVQEKSTGELNFGAGFSTADGALANVSVRERNLLGKGQDLRASIQRASRGTQIDLGFTEPYFLGHELATGFDLFRNTRDQRDESSFDSDTKGLVLRSSYPITEHLNHTLRYTIRNDEITNVQSDASLFIQQQEGINLTSMIGHVLLWDHRDNRFEPTSGYFSRFSQDFAGLGGDSKFVRHEVKAGQYWPFFAKEVVLSTTGKVGNITGWSDSDVRINERFFVGGTDIRGFKNAGIGPRDASTLDALGGNTYYAGSLEVMFPLGLPEELGIKGALFTDAGSLLSGDDDGAGVLDSSALRASAGVGFSWKSPLGPIRIDFASAFMKEDFDKEELVRFNFGTQF